ncbi:MULTISPECIES: metal-dependent hydrolase [Halorussus]|uniref:metal-dependent hydrolase n=1 Tax=Halorussus TaxID=1070314 RepID=UPI00209DF403|nr:metal-dependent hydrolase [Halorussus vallis]USZ75380.1 metal-dependent hydrolase [Halorussus vallis]
MFPLGHLGMALLFATPAAVLLAAPRRYAAVVVLALATALLPDVDTPLPLVHHHGGTHTVFFALVAAATVGAAFAAVAAATSQLARRISAVPAFSPRTAFALGAGGALAGLGSHLFADVLPIPIGGEPVEPLWPLSQDTVAFGLMHPGDPAWNWGLLAAGVGVQLLVVAFAYSTVDVPMVESSG